MKICYDESDLAVSNPHQGEPKSWMPSKNSKLEIDLGTPCYITDG